MVSCDSWLQYHSSSSAGGQGEASKKQNCVFQSFKGMKAFVANWSLDNKKVNISRREYLDMILKDSGIGNVGR